MSELRHAPKDWRREVTRLRHVDGEEGTFVGNSEPLAGVTPHGWLGVLVRFDGSADLVDVDPADLSMITERVEWAPARTPETANAPEKEFCGYDRCCHHMDSHDYSVGAGEDVPRVECPEGLCVR